MAPLPTPGGDSGVWGNILNTYLLVAHQADGTQNAEDVVNVPTAPITSTDVQAAINELASITATPGYYPVTSKNTNYTALVSDQVILGDSSGGAITITLPSPVVAGTGKVFTVRRINATGGSNVRVGLGAFTLDGKSYASNLYLLGAQWEALTVVSDGANWQRLDQWTQAFYGANPTAVQSRRLWVSANYGDDDNTGSTPWSAKQTINGALAAFPAGMNGEEIILDNGTYVEEVDLSALNSVSIRGTGRTTCTIRAPDDTSSAVLLGTGCKLFNLTLHGHTSGTYTGNILEIRAGFTIVKNVSIENNVGTIQSQRRSGVWDPVYGGIGIDISNSEHCLFENVALSELRTGIHMHTGAGGNSVDTFFKIFLTDVWQEVLLEGVAGTLLFHGMKAFNPQMNADSGYSWDLNCTGSTFLDCAVTEGAYNRAAICRGDHNTFINSEQAFNCKMYVAGDRNKFINWYTQNEIFLDGEWNDIDGMHKTSNGAVVINGNHNGIARYFQSGSATTNQIPVTDNGVGTRIEGRMTRVGPPSAGDGWREGDFVRNREFSTGNPEGWMNTVDSLGSPDPAVGTWIEVPSGDAAPIAGHVFLEIEKSAWDATGVVS